MSTVEMERPETQRPQDAPKAPAAAVLAAVRAASPEEVEQVRRQSQILEGAAPEDILAWALESYFPRFTMATGLGPEGCVIISMLARIEPRVHIFNLDTGYQFAETLALRERIMDKYGMTIALERPEATVAEYERGQWRPGLYGPARPLLLRPQGGRAASCLAEFRRLGDRHPSRSGAHPCQHAALSAGIASSAW